MPRARSTATRVREIVQKARDSGREGPEFEGLALIAEQLAGVVDRTREDPGRQLAALKELRATLDRLAAGPPTGAGSSSDGGADPQQPPAGGVSGDDPRRELALLVGSGPQVRDRADA